MLGDIPPNLFDQVGELASCGSLSPWILIGVDGGGVVILGEGGGNCTGGVSD